MEVDKYSQQPDHAFRLYQSDEALFSLRPVNDWLAAARDQPLPGAFFGDFWHEGEFCVLYSQAGLGAGLLAAQIAESTASGAPIAGLAAQFGPPTAPRKTLFCDFEFTLPRLAARAAAPGELLLESVPQFSENFYRAELYRGPESAVGEIHCGYTTRQKLGEMIRKCRFQVVVINSFSYLRERLMRPSEVAWLISGLNETMAELNLSLLVVEHVPEIAALMNASENKIPAVTRRLYNFCDAALALGQSSQGVEIRYLKQLKKNRFDLVHGSENVLVARLNNAGCFPQFEFVGAAAESAHMPLTPAQQKRRLLAASAQLLAGAGRSQRQIAEELAVSPATVNRVLKE
jgi:hypothetical protein